MFDIQPTLLDLEARLLPAERTFDEIPIWLPTSYGGFGDIMTTLKLAEGLKREFPDKKVTVYFGEKSDYEKVGRLYPDFDPTQPETRLNGISVAQVSEEQIREIMNRNVVGVYSPTIENANFTLRTDPRSILMEAGVNLYVEEYDCGSFPSCYEKNVVYVDKARRMHLGVKTGFQQGSAGVHIDPALVGLHTNATPEIKREMLDKAGFQWVLSHIPNLLQTEWGFSYAIDVHDSATTDTVSLPRALFSALKKTEQHQRAITIFEFSKFDPFEMKSSFTTPYPFTHIFFGREYKSCGSVKPIIKEGGKNTGITAPNVYFVHVGNQPHTMFQEFLRFSELPVLITGDASLSEAICLNKPFIYRAPSWKSKIPENLRKLATRLLADTSDVDRINALVEDGGIGVDKLFYDSDYVASFERLNTTIVENMNLAKNVAALIRQGVDTYLSGAGR